MTATADLLALEGWVTTALAALAPAARRRLFREIGTELRRRTRTRMARQTGPDGDAWPARRQQDKGKIRKTVKMMQGLRDTRRLLLAGGTDGIELGWQGRYSRIASVHHFGEVDYVDRTRSAQQVRYPVRRLIGLPPDDLAYVRGRILDHLSSTLG